MSDRDDPIPDAVVELAGVARARTRADGSFEVCASREDVVLMVRKPGHATASAVTSGRSDDTLVVRLGPERVRIGRVVDHAGRPVPNMAVRTVKDGIETGVATITDLPASRRFSG